MTPAPENPAVALLASYAELLRYLAQRRPHGSPGEGGQCKQAGGGCIRCQMLQKAERADEEAERQESMIPLDDAHLAEMLR